MDKPQTTGVKQQVQQAQLWKIKPLILNKYKWFKTYRTTIEMFQYI